MKVQWWMDMDFTVQFLGGSSVQSYTMVTVTFVHISNLASYPWEEPLYEAMSNLLHSVVVSKILQESWFYLHYCQWMIVGI